MKYWLYIVLFCCFFETSVLAQVVCQDRHAHHHRVTAKQTESMSDLTGTRSDTIDVLHYDIALDLVSFSPQNLSGTTTLSIVSKMANLAEIRLDLDNAFTVSEVLVNGNVAVFEQNGDLLGIALASPMGVGDTISVGVTYGGHPPTASFGGFYFTNTHAYNLGVGIGIDPPVYGRSWFPCVDNFVERSTFSFAITTASNRKAFCNGLLQNVATNADGTKVWHWSLFQTIPTYLASVAVSDYATISYDVPSVTGALVPVQLGDRPADTADLHQSFVHLPDAFAGFEAAWGGYAFDRVGFVVVPFNGGAMEHATNIAYPQFGVDGQLTWEHRLMAHEFAHHWFGDLVTCETASDMWLNEGWASYNESYFLEHVYGKERYNTNIRETNASVLQFAHIQDGDYLPVANVPFEATYSTHVYSKGALVAHSLRGYMGDSLFFSCVKDYLDTFAFKNASTAQFRDFLSQCSGINLTDFFEDWAYSPGFAHFSIDSVYSAFLPNSNVFNRIHIRQRLYEAPHYYNNVPLWITFFDNELNPHSEQITVSGGCTSATVVLPFYPVYAAVDWDEKLCDATTDEHRIINTTGIQTFTTEKAEVNVTNLSGELLLHVAHHWVMPDRPDPALPNVRLSPNRYWSVGGYQTDNFAATLQLVYDGSSSSSSGYLDNQLITGTENNLKIAFRSNSGANWQLLPSSQYTINTGSSANDKRGTITINQLQFGEYALAYTATTPDNLQTVIPACIATGLEPLPALQEVLQVAPNPTADSWTVTFAPIVGIDRLVVTDLSGKTWRDLVVKGQQAIVIPTTDLASGMYVLQAFSGNKLVDSVKVARQ